MKTTIKKFISFIGILVIFSLAINSIETQQSSPRFEALKACQSSGIELALCFNIVKE